MTSSLVGSEMCIRDSPFWRVDRSSSEEPRSRSHSKEDPNASADADLWPVSYTHLTLPTICSV
eukprot:2474122-Prorocentrum_lima.AAC.1